MFRIRIDIVNGITHDTLIQICDSEAHVVVRHELPHGNPHYHMYLQTSIKDTTLRQRFKRNFGFLKSSDYSIKKCDEERKNEYVQYMFNTKHGNRWEIIDVHNFDNQLLADLQKAAKEISDHFTANQQSKQRKGTTIWDLAQEVQTEFETKFNTVNNLGDDMHRFYEETEKQVLVYTDIAIKVMRKHHKAFDEFLLRKVITTAMSSTEKGKDMMRKKMLRMFLPRDI